MTKNISKLLLLGAVTLASCSDRSDEPNPVETDVNDGKVTTVRMALSRSAQDDFAAEGINQLTVFIYKQERTGSVLFDERTVDVSGGEFSLEFPLGDTYQTFAVANASSITGKESYETVTLHLDPQSMTTVWLSNVVKFAADKSTFDVNLGLDRVVAEVDFEPAETAEELASQTRFDNLSLTFNNVSTAYLVSKSLAVAESLTYTTDAARGYKTSFLTFETTQMGEAATMSITYLKNGEVVNRSAGDLETGVTFGASRRYRLVVPVTYDDFVENPWRAASRTGGVYAPITVECTSL